MRRCHRPSGQLPLHPRQCHGQQLPLAPAAAIHPHPQGPLLPRGCTWKGQRPASVTVCASQGHTGAEGHKAHLAPGTALDRGMVGRLGTARRGAGQGTWPGGTRPSSPATFVGEEAGGMGLGVGGAWDGGSGCPGGREGVGRHSLGVGA